MKYPINEVRRWQKLAGILTEDIPAEEAPAVDANAEQGAEQKLEKGFEALLNQLQSAKKNVKPSNPEIFLFTQQIVFF